MAETFPAAALPTLTPGGDRAGVAAGIAAWITSPAMTALLGAFGCPPSRTAPLGDRLAEVELFSEVWDSRKGLERHQATARVFPSDLDKLIRAAAVSLGLADQEKPLHDTYDHVLVLGGGVLTMVARSALAASILQAGVSAATVAGLGSLRPLENQEETARRLGLRPCPTEGDAVDEALRQQLKLGEPTERAAGPDWWVRSYPEATPVVHVLAAPSTRPGKRANTADTYLGWAELVQPAPRGSRVLLVTTDLFVPFQHCDALRVLGLGYGLDVETVGFSRATSAWVKPAQTSEVLQEVRSAIMSMRALYLALD